MAIPAKADPVKFCRNCGAELKRKRFGKRLEDRTRFLSRETCGQACGNTKETVTRSAHQVRAKPYRKASCEQCGTTAKLHVHHKDRNWANDDPANLQTLCASCHLKLHWWEDRAQRLAVNPWWRGANTNPLLGDGSASWDGPRQVQPSRQGAMVDTDFRRL